MSEPISFTSHTPRFEIPLLFAGQAQKEFFFNEAQIIIDALLQTSVEGIAISPPVKPVDGQCWIVSNGAEGEWSGQDKAVAVRHGSGWKYIVPQEGMKAYNKFKKQHLIFRNGWAGASEPTAASGGATVDSEARAAIDSLTTSLRDAGVLAPL